MAPTKVSTKVAELKKQQEAEALRKQQLLEDEEQEQEEADSDEETDSVVSADSDSEEESADSDEEADSDSDEEEEEAPAPPKAKAAPAKATKPQAPKPKAAPKPAKATKPAKAKPEPKPRRAFVDPLEIKELILLDTKGGKTKAGKLLDRLSKQLEKVMAKMAKRKEAGPRKLSAYNVYTKQHMADVQDIESKLRMKELGQRWKALSDKEKAKYQKLATEANAAAQTA